MLCLSSYVIYAEKQKKNQIQFNCRTIKCRTSVNLAGYYCLKVIELPYVFALVIGGDHIDDIGACIAEIFP